MIIDTHVHFSDEPGYADNLAAECGRLGIGKVCLLGGNCNSGKIEGGILDALKTHPDLYLGFGMFRLGDDPPEAVKAFHDAGFKGLKCICPRSRYDDKAYYPVYRQAEELRMPMLFHLGIVGRSDDDGRRDVNCDRMRPVHLDTIARAFPGLMIIGAHFGNPWTDEAAMIARWNPNVFFDLSGSILKYRSREYFHQLLWWGRDPDYMAPDKTGPWDKLLFGSDVKISSIEGVMADYRGLLGSLWLSDVDRAKVWGGNAAKLLGIQ
jgi:hypothetical protein